MIDWESSETTPLLRLTTPSERPGTRERFEYGRTAVATVVATRGVLLPIAEEQRGPVSADTGG